MGGGGGEGGNYRHTPTIPNHLPPLPNSSTTTIPSPTRPHFLHSQTYTRTRARTHPPNPSPTTPILTETHARVQGVGVGRGWDGGWGRGEPRTFDKPSNIVSEILPTNACQPMSANQRLWMSSLETCDVRRVTQSCLFLSLARLQSIEFNGRRISSYSHNLSCR